MTPTRAAVTWGLLFVAAFANGALRQAGYARWTSELHAHQISCLTGILLFGAVIAWAARRWPFASFHHALKVGICWMAATIAFEFLFMHFAAGHSWGRLLAEYEFWNGRLWTLVLASLAAWPVFSWWRAAAKAL
jgi:hypothetical protein